MKSPCDGKEECEFCAAGNARLYLKRLEAGLAELAQELDNVVAVCDAKQQMDTFAQARRRLSVLTAEIGTAEILKLPEYLEDVRRGYERVQKEIAKMESTMNLAQRKNKRSEK